MANEAGGAIINSMRMGKLEKKMKASVEFLGTQRFVTKAHSLDIPISEKTRVNDALEYIRHRYPDLSLDEGMIVITVNQEVASLDRILKANDTVLFLPLIGGG
jgi:molybdopterin converting factor small subunit